MQFDEVKAEHFSTISRTPFPHVQIDHQLVQMSTHLPDGGTFRARVLKAAGWHHHNLTPLGKYPHDAASAYNRVRSALAQTDDPQQLLVLLGS